MNLNEFKAHIEATRKASTMQGMSVLAATITPTQQEKENK